MRSLWDKIISFNCHLMLHCVNSLDVFLQVAVVVECHATLITHDVFGLQMNFVNMLTKVRVFSFAVGTLGLAHKVTLGNVFWFSY